MVSTENLELSEIEATLLQHPDVRLCAALVRTGIAGNQRLIAYIVPAPTASEYAELSALKSETPTFIRHIDPKCDAFLRDRLPEAMVPKTYVFMLSFSLTPQGQIDREALPPPWTRRPSLCHPLELPSSQTERQVAAIWQELLQVDAIGLDDVFFELGGHSLLMLRSQPMLSNVLQRKISIIALLQNPTVRTLAACIDRMRCAEAPAESANVSTRAVREQAISRLKSRLATTRSEG
jgi:hypothetical protein